MGKYCAIKSCPSGRKIKNKTNDTHQSLSYFRPTTTDRLANWKESLGIELKSTDYICHLHFKADDMKMYDKIYIKGKPVIIPTGKKMLKDDALPTVKHQFIPTKEFKASLKYEQGRTNHSDEHGVDRKRIEEIELLEQESNDNLMDNSEESDVEDPLLSQNAHKNKQLNTKATQPLDMFRANIRKFSMLPPSWLYIEKPEGLEFMHIDPTTKQIQNHIRLNGDLTITVIYPNKEESQLNKKISSYNDTYAYLKTVERWPRCVGTQIGQKFSTKCKSVIVGDDAYKRNRQHPRCKPCRILRNRLQNKTKTARHDSYIVIVGEPQLLNGDLKHAPLKT